ncbi:metallophosphoesterase [Aureitalea sp. L0-47]|uniref:metallophosphoesterase n=1 Tax=Aureitalea sp. L0-47 TaxID=2816962 RepID=UPI002238EBFA|nr:metallophosphoesterase [Aureitalea sp. L0-47]MCW5520400.1 metallophosphoesterase [Aureitalea sp. L0-47]
MCLFNRIISLLLTLALFGCGSYKAKYLSEEPTAPSKPSDSNIEKRIYLIGDAGGAEPDKTTDALAALENLIDDRDTSEDHLIFLGDNIYEKGLPKKKHKKRKEAEHRIDVQIDLAKEFDGTSMFIPGNHDWYSKGLGGLKRQEEYLEDKLKNNEVFQPENGCPVENFEISPKVALIVLDTQWYITDWDKHPTINDECDIKTRKGFFLEIEDKLKDNNNKTVVIAMHHPAITYGLHGGYFNFNKHIFAKGNTIPLPGLASLVTLVRSLGGVSPQDRYNNRYNELMQRLITMAAGNDKVVFTSGHEHTLQYIEANGVKQIVSGAGAKRAPVNLGNGAKFVSGEQGFAVLDIFKDGSSKVSFYDSAGGKPTHMFTTEVYPPEKHYDVSSLPDEFPETIKASIYEKSSTEVSSRYEWFWGDHYRHIYGTEVEVPVKTLDDFYGGFTVERKGGGHQTRSLRLVDPKGRNFALRAVKKSAVQFLQTVVFKDTYVEEDFRETLTEEAVLDFYTSSHPFAGFVVPDLSEAIGVYHTNPVLFYMPKHKALGDYNDEFGDELYILEERPDDGFLDVESFGKPDSIESTSDVLENLRDDEKYRIDEEAFIRARLFDMLLGDWDRHQDQWRWSRFDISDDERVYRPIPRDRDQVFSNYDGALLDFMKLIIPSTKQFQEFNGDFKDHRWINLAGMKIDRTFTQNSGREVWLEQARFISNKLNDEVIDIAFNKLPPEVIDETSEDIKKKLKSRREQLEEVADAYYEYLSKLVIITATDKDDHIHIERGDNFTEIAVSRIKDGEVRPPFKKRKIYSAETKEIWVYGLDDDDEIVVTGKPNNPIRLRIIGGQNNDKYTIENGRKVKVYDHKSKPNTIVQRGGANINLRDNYRYNIYRYDKYVDGVTNFIPSIGFNPDDGMLVGLSITSAVKGFKNDPFQVKHSLRGGYFFATEGFDLQYTGEFANILNKWNVLLGGRFTSENFTRNFFGFGNETGNPDDELGMDFNRVKTSIRSARLGAVKEGHYGSRIEITGQMEAIEVEPTDDRFISQEISDNEFFDDRRYFGTIDVTYSYAGYDVKVVPTRGMFFKLKTGITTNLEDSDRTFGYIIPSLEFYNAITRNRKLVLRTQAQGQVNIGDSFEFYQAAVLGANTGLRGFRTERFSGERALALSTDLRYKLVKFNTGLLPLKLSVFGGYDIGRVWIDGEDSNTWNDSAGGGFIINAIDTISGQFGVFNSDDGLRFSFVFGVSL